MPAQPHLRNDDEVERALRRLSRIEARYESVTRQLPHDIAAVERIDPEMGRRLRWMQSDGHD